MKPRLSWSVGVAFLLCATCGFGCAEGGAEDLETIRAAVDSYAESVKTLEGKYVRTLGPAKNAKVDPRLPRDQRAEATFLAEFPSGKAFHDERMSYWEPGKNGEKVPFDLHETSAFDGRPYWLVFTHVKSAVETTLPADFPHSLTVGSHDQIRNSPMPWDFSGLRLLQQGTLSGILRKPGIKIEGSEEVHGARCVRVVEIFNKERVFAAWLDPAHDYLPRRIELTHPKVRFDILEFRKYPDAAGGGELWFPMRGQFQYSMGEVQQNFEVVELTINGPIEPHRFSIREADLPDGVRVGGVSDGYTGGRQDLWVERKQLMNEYDRRLGALLAPQKPPAKAIDSSGLPYLKIAADVVARVHWLVWLLVAEAIVLIIARGIVRARRAGRPSERATAATPRNSTEGDMQ